MFSYSEAGWGGGEACLQLDSLKEVSLLGLGRVLKEFSDVGTHSGCVAG